MGGVHYKVEALRRGRTDSQVRAVLMVLLTVSIASFGMKLGVSLNLIGFSEIFRLDFLNQAGFSSGFLTDFSKSFVIYLNKEVDFLDIDTELGGFFGASNGEFSVGLDVFFTLYKRGFVLFGISSTLGIHFLSIGPTLEIDI